MAQSVLYHPTTMKWAAVLGFVIASAVAFGQLRGGASRSAERHLPFAEHQVSFEKEVAPVLAMSCMTSSCHGNGIRPPLLDRTLDASHLRGALVGVASEQRPARALVVAGDPSKSWLMDKLEGHISDAECVDHDCGVAMPKDNPKLSNESLATIRTWIAQGALDN